MNLSINQPVLANIRPEYRSCFKCRYEGNIDMQACPRCGRPLYTATNIRLRGALMIALGLFLTGLMSAITILVTGLLAQAAKDPRNSAQLNEEPHMFVIVYLIFGGVIAIGLSATVAGAWMTIFGRRNMFLIWIFLALISITFAVGGIFQGLAG